MSVLACKGGTPVIDPKEYKRAPWPPVDMETAEMLKDLYLSGKWSFNSEMEQKFEQEFAEYHNAEYAVFMANGTVTLECALQALGVRPGDEVIVPGLTWIATAMAVHYVGAIPVFADIEEDTLCLSPEAFEKAITPKTRVVIPVHLYGSMANLDRIIEIADAHNIAVLEDCAHMQGGKWRGKGAGSWGAIGSFSFQQSKTLTSGEGGICITNDLELSDRLYRAKHIGYSRLDPQGAAKSAPPADLICHNYRGLAFPALLLSRQLKELPARIERMKKFAAALKELENIPGVRLQSPGKEASPQGYYAIEIILDPAIWGKARTAAATIHSEGIPVATGNYGPVYKHMLFNCRDFRNTGCPVSDFMGEQAFSLSHTGMEYPEMVPFIEKAFRKVYENREEL